MALGSYPVTPLLDDFNRANGALGSAWAIELLAGSAPAIASNQAKSADGSSVAVAYYDTTFGGNQEIFIKVPTRNVGPGEPSAYLMARCDAQAFATTTGYGLFWDDATDELHIIRIDTGFSLTSLDSAVVTFADGDYLGIRCNGSTIDGMLGHWNGSAWAWSTPVTATDATYDGTGGTYAAVVFPASTAIRYDDVRAGTIPYTDTVDVVSGTNVLVLDPTGTPNGRAVTFQHGMGDDHLFTQQWRMAEVIYWLTTAGYVVAASATTASHFGNSAAQAIDDDVYPHLVANYGVTAGYVMFAESMGGLVALLLVANGSPNIRGVIGWSAACDNDALYVADYGGVVADLMDTAYGGTYTNPSPAHNPITRTVSLYTGKRYRFYIDAGDPIVPPADHGTAMASYLSAGFAETVSATGPHTSDLPPTDVNYSDLLDFVDQSFTVRHLALLGVG